MATLKPFTHYHTGNSAFSGPGAVAGSGSLTFTPWANTQGTTALKVKWNSPPSQSVLTGQSYERQVMHSIKSTHHWLIEEIHPKVDGIALDFLLKHTRTDRRIYVECKGGKGLARTDTMKKTIGLVDFVQGRWDLDPHVSDYPTIIVVTSQLPTSKLGQLLVNHLGAYPAVMVVGDALLIPFLNLMS